MCGICGKIDFEGREISESLIHQMTFFLSHRGPDDEGIYINNLSQDVNHHKVSVGLGHRRLSIIDLSKAGHQPMSNEDGTIWLIFNGEIYNFRELRTELEHNGHRMKSKTDCEVIVHLYEEEGMDCVKKLNGMFAFALWDERKKNLILCRDRFGIKPLYYHWNGNSLVFASELKSILSDPDVPKRMNWNALNLYLSFNYVPAPMTMFEEIHKVNPGCMVIVKNTNLTTQSYWKIDVAPEQGVKDDNLEAHKAKIFDLLEDSVRKRLIADVPIGVFLSGGIDSSIITGLASRLSDSPINTYSIGYEDVPLFDETHFSREVARFNNTNHQEIILNSREVMNVIPEVLASFDEPFADSSAIPTYIISRETQRFAKVALSGEGADELFAGYRNYTGEYWYSRYRFLPRLLRKKVIEPLILSLSDSREKYPQELIRRVKKFSTGAKDEFENRFYSWNEIFPRELREKIILNSSDIDNIDFDSGRNQVHEKLNLVDSDKINRMLYVDFVQSLPNDMLTKVDLMSMRNSLEVRVPFLDHRLVQYVFQIPGNLKLRGRKGKFVLLETFKPILPKMLHNRPKWGFEIPLSKWLKTDLKFLIEENLSQEKIKKQGIFDFETIEKLTRALLSNRSDTSWHLWNLISFQNWYSRWFSF